MPDGIKADLPSAAHIIAERIEREGPIPLGDYMAIANDYYYASKDPLGEEGDFVTAPEISQMFGEIIGIWLADLWLRQGSPDHCHYVELGPGRGTLAKDALRSMRKFGCHPSVHFVETSPLLKAKQAQLHPDAIWHDDISSLPEDGPLLMVANEFFDALPIEQFVATSAGWRRQMVARDRSKFVGVPSEEVAEERVGSSMSGFPDDTILERSPVSVEVMGHIASRIAKQGGTMLIIDYGYTKPGTGSTLQAVKDHMPVSPFDSPGSSDLTAHVDFHTLANIARTRMLKIHGPAEQGQWLKSLGIDQRAEALIAASPKETDTVLAAHQRLTHVDEMGRLFRVMAATAIDWPEPEGFSYGEE
ncbi:SAM-dependent methyltransferase [Sphingorhabdus sp. YGSMI21]|uniref:class I SAM-dependent methyltransferase n=1 Tax=Sphingorhabdus sp. YGSMI21 TaxID=2077182 RepID=UPI001F0BC8DE|nr:SAM-dependent methyltransferase [Sphingorhabdus sp. YGSMI21]